VTVDKDQTFPWRIVLPLVLLALLFLFVTSDHSRSPTPTGCYWVDSGTNAHFIQYRGATQPPGYDTLDCGVVKHYVPGPALSVVALGLGVAFLGSTVLIAYVGIQRLRGRRSRFDHLADLLASNAAEGTYPSSLRGGGDEIVLPPSLPIGRRRRPRRDR